MSRRSWHRPAGAWVDAGWGRSRGPCGRFCGSSPPLARDPPGSTPRSSPPASTAASVFLVHLRGRRCARSCARSTARRRRGDATTRCRARRHPRPARQRGPCARSRRRRLAVSPDPRATAQSRHAPTPAAHRHGRGGASRLPAMRPARLDAPPPVSPRRVPARSSRVGRRRGRVPYVGAARRDTSSRPRRSSRHSARAGSAAAPRGSVAQDGSATSSAIEAPRAQVSTSASMSTTCGTWRCRCPRPPCQTRCGHEAARPVHLDDRPRDRPLRCAQAGPGPALRHPAQYRPAFPARFGSIQDARAYCHDFFPWSQHRTPAQRPGAADAPRRPLRSGRAARGSAGGRARCGSCRASGTLPRRPAPAAWSPHGSLDQSAATGSTTIVPAWGPDLSYAGRRDPEPEGRMPASPPSSWTS
jgi:hypothetical protein